MALNIFRSEIVFLLSRKSLKDPEFRKGRLGVYDFPLRGENKPRIWFHAVSVGEVTGAVPTIFAVKKRMPEAELFLSTGTPQGLRSARAQLPEEVRVFPFPLDFPKYVGRAIATVRPDLFVAFETEFWPNFYRRLARGPIPALLLNGRVSESSARFYRMASPLFQPVFKHFSKMAMHSAEDLARAVEIGAPREKLMVLGSSKYDGLAGRALPERAGHWKKVLGIAENTPVIIGGSLRGSECVRLMQILEKLRKVSPGALGIFVPRHLRNIGPMVRWLTERRIPYDLLSNIEKPGGRRRTAPVVLVDKMGVLFELYSAGDLIFCGGTLEPVGGHNILEPAAWAKPVFYGPHLKKVLHEHRILLSFGGSFPVVDSEDLLSLWIKWIANLPGLEGPGRRAREALQSFGGIVDRQVDLILESILKKRS